MFTSAKPLTRHTRPTLGTVAGVSAFRRLPFRTLLNRLALAAVAIAIVGCLVWASRAHSVRQLVPLPTADAIGPGVGISVTYADGSDATSCTAGFLVRTKHGGPGLLSAGHCNRPGGPGTVAIRYAGQYPTVGTFTERVYGGNAWNHSDIGLITVDDTANIPLAAEVDGHPVTGVADQVKIGDTLCHFGFRSGEPMCGPVAARDHNKVRFAAAASCGDSGGPAYLVRPDGTAQAVGILTTVPDGADPDTACDAPRNHSVAQLIKPWLQAWQLTLVTATP